LKRLARYLTYRSWFVGLALAGLTLLALFGSTRLTIDPANEQLFLRHSASYRTYQRFVALFGNDETILVALHDPTQSILTPGGLAAVRGLTRDLAGLPYVEEVFSLTNAPDMARLTMTPFGISAPRLIGGDALSQTNVAAIRHNQLVIGTLLSDDLHTAGLLVMPNQTITSPTARQAWIVAVRKVAARHAAQGRQTYVAGTPLERHDVTYYLERDQQRIVPLVFLILLGVTYSIYRVKRLALIPPACVLISLAWTMGLVGFAGRPLNTITSLLPPVVMVVSISAAIHLLNQYIDEIEAGVDHTEAVENAVRHVGMACFLTSLTTALGFFSLLFSPVPAVREFALFAGIGVLLSFVVTIMCVPVALRYSGTLPLERLRHLKEGAIEGLLDRLIWWVSAHRGRIFAGTMLLLVGLCPGIWRLTEGTDIIRALKPHAPLRVSSEFIDQHLTGVNSLELLVQISGPPGPMAAATIRQVLAFSRWLRQQPGVTAVYSPWQPLTGVRAELLTQDTQLTALATLLPLVFPMQAWLAPNAQELRISARATAMRSDQFLALAQSVERQAEHVHLPLQVTGHNYLLAQMSRTLVQTQIRALGFAAVMILGTMALALRSWRLGLLAVIPNVLPPLMIFGLMGWCGIALSAATTMIASVALGLIVDDTIHLLYRYKRECQTHGEGFVAIEQALRHTGRALISTTIILTLGFWAGILGSFRPTVHFSFLTGLTMILALVADLLVTPATVLAAAGEPGTRLREARQNLMEDNM
jgi:predicted RND superfamily exporter protein